MNSEKILILVFKKNNGASFRFGVAFPDSAVEASDVKALGTAMISNGILSFADGSALATLDKAFMQETTSNAISVN